MDGLDQFRMFGQIGVVAQQLIIIGKDPAEVDEPAAEKSNQDRQGGKHLVANGKTYANKDRRCRRWQGMARIQQQLDPNFT